VPRVMTVVAFEHLAVAIYHKQCTHARQGAP
jgi:hypothetical protein